MRHALPSTRVARLALATGAVLLVPLAASLLGDEVRWGPGDFAAMGALLLGAGLLLDFVLRVSGWRRVAGVTAVAAACLWLWAELAVGVFTSWGT